MIEKDLISQFPRTGCLPTQSSKYWAKEKDRYIRQLLILDIESITERKLLVYFARADKEMTHQDAENLAEVIEGIQADRIDLMLQTPGGNVAAVEKYVSVLQQSFQGQYRVMVANRAKSGGTVICLSSKEILLGNNSELGPIDPQMTIPQIGFPIPCEILSEDETILPSLRKMAETAAKGQKNLAKKYLSKGMLKEKTNEDIDKVIQRISSPYSYTSHGSVIDYSEAKELGLSVKKLEADSDLWRKIWLLHCLYDFDINLRGIAVIQEGARYSIALRN